MGLLVYLLHRFQEYTLAKDEQAREAVRRQQFRRFERTALDLVDDPREAGMTILHLAAGHELSRVQLGAMEWVARHLMQADAPADLVARGRWLSRQAHDPVVAVERMTEIVRDALTPSEWALFADAVADIARADGAPVGARLTVVETLAPGATRRALV
jgi:hypothetical protein